MCLDVDWEKLWFRNKCSPPGNSPFSFSVSWPVFLSLFGKHFSSPHFLVLLLFFPLFLFSISLFSGFLCTHAWQLNIWIHSELDLDVSRFIFLFIKKIQFNKWHWGSACFLMRDNLQDMTEVILHFPYCQQIPRADQNQQCDSSSLNSAPSPLVPTEDIHV